MKHKVSALVLAAAGLLAVCFAGVASAAGDVKSEITQKDVKALLREFKNKKGFESEEVGSFMLSLAKKCSALLDDDDDDDDDDMEDRLIMESLDNLTGITMADASDCSPSVREQFRTRVETLLKGCDLLMEANDDGEKALIYGSPAPDGKYIRNLIIYDGDGCELVCLWGKIDTGLLSDGKESVK